MSGPHDASPGAAGTPNPDPGLLRDLVAEVLERMEDEGDHPLDEVCRRHPELAALVRKRVSRLAGIGFTPTPEVEFPERLGDFRLVERLGSGGMGVVFRAWQESLQRHVAVKLVRPEHLYFPGARERFRREADAVARLSHPGIVAIYTVGEEGGLPFFTMELVAGCTLADLVAGLQGSDPRALSGRDVASVLARFADTPEPPVDPIARFGRTWTDVVLGLVGKIVQALAHAHARGILHRDLKPSNVMVTPEGRVVLMDFGLALAEGNTKLTRTGALLGSIPYMAPEQLRGDAAAIGARSDVYSIGVLIYELLALRPPFHAETSEATRELVLRGAPLALRARNPAVPPEVATICACAMDLDPGRRYPNAAALHADLEAFAARRPISARPAGAWLRLRRVVERHPVAASLLLLAVVLVVGGPLTYAFGTAQERDAAVAARELAERRSYVAQIAVADVSLRLDDVAAAKRALRGCAQGLHGWEWRHLQGQTDTARRVVRLPEGCEARELAYDAREDAITVLDAQGKLWRLAADGEAVTALPLERKVIAFAMHPRTDRLAIVGEEGTVSTHDARTGARVADLGSVRRVAPLCAFAHEGASLLVGDQDGTVHVLDPETGKETNSLAMWPQVGRLAVTRISTGQDVVVGRAQDGQWSLFDVATGQPCRIFEDTERANLFAASRDGTRIAASTGTSWIRVHRLDAAERSTTIALDLGAIRWIGFAGDDRSLLTAHGDGTLREWDLAREGEAAGAFRGHERAVLAAATARTRREIVTASSDGTLRIWNEGGHRSPLRSARADPWHVAPAAVEPATTLATGPRGAHWARGYDSGAIELADASGRCVRTLHGHDLAVSALAWQSDEEVLLSAGCEGALCAWRAGDGGLLWRVPTPGHVVVALLLAGGGTHVWTIGSDDVVRRIATGDGTVVRELTVSGAASGVAELTADGETLLVGTPKGQVVALGAEGERPLRALKAPLPALARPGAVGVLAAAAEDPGSLALGPFGRPIFCAAPGGTRVALGSEGGGVRILDAEDGTILLTLARRGAALQALAWSPADDRLIAEVQSGETLIWSGAPRGTPPSEAHDPEDASWQARGLEFGSALPTSELATRVRQHPDLSESVRKRLLADLATRAPEPRRFLHEARRHLLALEEGEDTLREGHAAARAAAAALPEASLAQAYLALAALRAKEWSTAKSAVENARRLTDAHAEAAHPVLLACEAWLHTVDGDHDEAKASLDAAWARKSAIGFRHDRLVGALLAFVGKELDRARH